MYRTLVPLILLMAVGCDSGGGSSTPAVTNTQTAPVDTPPPLAAAPEPQVPPAPDNPEVSISETALQTEVDTAPASQESQSESFMSTNAVEAVQPEPAASETFAAISSVQIIYGAG